MVAALILALLPVLSQQAAGLSPDLAGLKLVHIVFRHGDRNPIDLYTNDPYKDRKFWPEGYGQLTNVGKRQHYQLGQWLRKRYTGFLGTSYLADEVYVRSTDVDRTLMSVESNLAGLYPPTDPHTNWNPDIAWQPIPVHTLPQSDDYLLSSHAACPRFEHLQKELLVSAEFRKLYDDNRELFEYISANTGDNITDITNLDYVYDTLFIESNHNLTLPDWTNKVFPDGKFRELRDLSFLVDTWTHELKRLKGGPFVKELLEHCTSLANGALDPLNRKLFIYSGHDTTVAPILHTLDVYKPVLAPPYASTILFELMEREAKYFLRVSYKNETDQEPHVLILPGCIELCPLEKFKELTASIIPADWRQECGFPSVSPLESRVTLIAALASSSMAAIVLLAVCAILCKKSRNLSGEEVRYQPVAVLDDAA